MRPDNSPGRRRILLAAATVLLAGTLVAGCGSADAGTPTINLYNAPQQNLGAMVARCNELADGQYRIKLNTLPRDADGQREQLVRRLAAGDAGMDVLGLDVTWTAELAEAGWIREWTGANKAAAEKGTLAAPLATARYHGKLYAAPYNTNVQLLWYRDDLLPTPPSTWDGLMKAADRLAAKDKPHYVEVQGAQYEGLTVWFNSMLASAGGRLMNKAGTKAELGKPAVKALTTMRDFARSKAADPSMSNMQEDETRLAVEGGRGFAEVNWPFVYPAMQDDKPALAKHFKWAPFPGIDGPGRSPLGGANFAVSRYSKHPQQAFRAALCLRDPANQKIAATKDGLPPTIESVYHDPEMAKAYPMRDAILAALHTAAARPVTPTYQNISTVVSAALSPPSAIDPVPVEQSLRQQIADAIVSKGVLP